MCQLSAVADIGVGEILKMSDFEARGWKIDLPAKHFGAFRRAARAPLGPEKRPSLPVLILLAAAPHWI